MLETWRDTLLFYRQTLLTELFIIQWGIWTWMVWRACEESLDEKEKAPKG